jgi:hypothetical protein
MLIDDLINKFRDVYGLSVADFPDDTLETLVAAGLKKISVIYPAHEMSYVSVVAGQTRYSVSHTGLIRIKEVYYPKDYNDDPFGDAIPESLDMTAGSLSRSYEFLARMKLMNEIYPFEGRIVDHQTFDLLPTPDVGGTRAYYEYLRYRTLAEMPDLFEDDLIEYVFFIIKDKAFKKQAVSSGDGYNFDRRGNISVDKETVDGNKAHYQIEVAIQKRIKDKVLSI